MKMHFFARILMLIFVFSLMTWTSVPAETENAPGASGDSQEDDWYRSSDITKDIDTDQTGAAGSSGNKSTSTGKEKNP